MSPALFFSANAILYLEILPLLYVEDENENKIVVNVIIKPGG